MAILVPTACSAEVCGSCEVWNCTLFSFLHSITFCAFLDNMEVVKHSNYERQNSGHHAGTQKEALCFCLLLKAWDMRIQASWPVQCNRAQRTFLPCCLSHFIVWKGHGANKWVLLSVCFPLHPMYCEWKLMHFAWLLQRSSKILSLSEQVLANVLCFCNGGFTTPLPFRLLMTGKLKCWSFSDVTNVIHLWYLLCHQQHWKGMNLLYS